MKRPVFILLACLSTSPTLAEESGSDLLADANAAYEAGKYAEAADAYTKAIEQSGSDASVLYNLGNAHFRQEQYGFAILAYERALVLDPRAPDIHTNLELARKTATAFEEKQDPALWKKPLHWLSFNEWLLATCVAIGVLAMASLTRAFLPDRKGRLALRWVTAASVIVFVTGIGAVVARHGELDRAIVVRSGARVHLSPFGTADVVATLKEGRTVRVGQEHEGFYHIPNGWVSKDDVKRITEKS